MMLATLITLSGDSRVVDEVTEEQLMLQQQELGDVNVTHL